MNMQTTRRALLGTLALAPVASAAIALSPRPTSGMAAIFHDWQSAHEALGETDSDAAQEPLLDRINRAETAIMEAADTAPLIAEYRLWVALFYAVDCDAELEEAAYTADIERLKIEDPDLPWGARLIARAIQAIREDRA